MSSVFTNGMVNREVSFCRVYSKEAKDRLEKLFLKNRISYFVQWQERSFIARLLGAREKNVFTIKINEEDVPRATELVQGVESIRIRKPNGGRQRPVR